MSRFTNDNLISGVFLVLLGAATTLYSVSKYEIGTVDRMGPGMYPMALGALLAICGIIIAISAWFRTPEGISIDYRALLLVIFGIVLFGLLIDPFGLVPATLALVFSSNLASGRFRPLQSIVLAVLVSVGSVLVFNYGLRVPIRLFEWPS